MKKLSIFLFTAAAFTLFAINSNAQNVVKKPLIARHLVTYRTPRPSVKHFWVDTEWKPEAGTYVEVPEHWAIAPHPHALWLSGEWRKRKSGYVWIPGMWK